MSRKTAIPPVSSRTIAQRVSQELRLITQGLHEIETAMDTLLVRQDLNLRCETIRDIQQLDSIGQAIIALADYLEDAGQNMCGKDNIDISSSLERVRLQAISNRLSGISRSISQTTEPVLF